MGSGIGGLSSMSTSPEVSSLVPAGGTGNGTEGVSLVGTTGPNPEPSEPGSTPF